MLDKALVLHARPPEGRSGIIAYVDLCPEQDPVLANQIRSLLYMDIKPPQEDGWQTVVEGLKSTVLLVFSLAIIKSLATGYQNTAVTYFSLRLAASL